MSKFRSRLFSLLRETSGNFGMMTALLLPVSVGVVGLGLDATNMIQNKRAMQNAVDAAALATATAMTNNMSKDAADAMAKSYVQSQLANSLSDATTASANLTASTNISTTDTGNGTIYDVGLTSSYTMQTNALSQAFGWKSVTISAYGKAEASTVTSSTGPEGNPLSMYLALDRSGSMNDATDTTYSTTCTDTYWTWFGPVTNTYACTQYYTKIQSLKLAVQSLAAKLNANDPTNSYVRMGADSYNSAADAQQAMGWGTAKVVSYVNALQASGGTDATGALAAAYSALKASNKTEANAHKTSDFKRYVVFLTDGEMTGNSNTWNATIDSNVRNMCNQIKADKIEIFTVAFNAPPNGKSLLNFCATDSSHYFEATNTASLVAAFTSIGKTTTKPTTTRLTN